MKSTTKKSFQISGPLRSVGIKAGAGGVRVALNGQEVVSVRNAAPDRPGGATANAGAMPADDDISTIALGRLIADQKSEQQPAKSTDDGNDDERPIVVGPITPIPTPAPISAKPQPRVRLGL